MIIVLIAIFIAIVAFLTVETALALRMAKDQRTFRAKDRYSYTDMKTKEFDKKVFMN